MTNYLEPTLYANSTQRSPLTKANLHVTTQKEHVTPIIAWRSNPFTPSLILTTLLHQLILSIKILKHHYFKWHKRVFPNLNCLRSNHSSWTPSHTQETPVHLLQWAKSYRIPLLFLHTLQLLVKFTLLSHTHRNTNTLGTKSTPKHSSYWSHKACSKTCSITHPRTHAKHSL